MMKFKSMDLLLVSIFCCICWLPKTLGAGVNIPNDYLGYLRQLVSHDESIAIEFNWLAGEYPLDNNMTADLLRLLQSGQSLGFSFYNRWENIASSMNATTSGLECFQQLAALVQGLGNNDLASYKYFDSWGKISAGILEGNLVELGNFDECLDLKKSSTVQGEIVGKNCFAKLPIGSAFTYSPLGQIFKLKIAVCMPAVCSAQEFDIFYKQFLKTVFKQDVGPNTVIVDEKTCKLRELPPLKPMSVFAIVVLSILIAAMCFGSFYDFFMKLANKKPHPLLRVFSVQANLGELLRIVPNTKSKNVIPCLNGIRCMSLIWVIFGHSLTFTLLQPHINVIDMVTWARTAYSMLFQQAIFAVDSFFFLSGLLISFLAMREMERNNGKLNIPMMYVHRIIRLLPMLALAILVYTTLYKDVTTAPLWEDFGNASLFCRQNWWLTLLFVQNYVKNEEICLGHTWYLGVDMQLYILSPIFLIALYRWKKKGVAGIVTLGLLLVACLFTTMMINDLRYHTGGFNIVTPNTMKKSYDPTHIRASPWLIGLLLGYYLHNNRHQRVILPKLAVLFCWLASFVVILTIIFAWYPQAQVNAKHSTTLEEALYCSLGRVAWPLALAWIVFACVNDYGGPVNAFLSCPIWQPFSRLSYCMYIWHIYIEGFNAGLVKTNTYFSNWDMTLHFWADYGWTIIFSTFMYLAFEAPLVNIEKILLPKRRSQKTITASPQRNLVAVPNQNELSAKANEVLQPLPV